MIVKRKDFNVKQHDYNVKRHEYNVKQRDYNVKRHDYNDKRNEYNVMQHEYKVMEHDYSGRTKYSACVSKLGKLSKQYICPQKTQKAPVFFNLKDFGLEKDLKF